MGMLADIVKKGVKGAKATWDKMFGTEPEDPFNAVDARRERMDREKAQTEKRISIRSGETELDEWDGAEHVGKAPAPQVQFDRFEQTQQRPLPENLTSGLYRFSDNRQPVPHSQPEPQPEPAPPEQPDLQDPSEGNGMGQLPGIGKVPVMTHPGFGIQESPQKEGEQEPEDFRPPPVHGIDLPEAPGVPVERPYGRPDDSEAQTPPITPGTREEDPGSPGGAFSGTADVADKLDRIIELLEKIVEQGEEPQTAVYG
jgi:hypothetical protein